MSAEWKRIKALADSAFKEGSYDTSAALYTQSLQHLGNTRGVERKKIHSNRCQAYVKNEEWTLAFIDAKLVLDIDASWQKGWFR